MHKIELIYFIENKCKYITNKLITLKMNSTNTNTYGHGYNNRSYRNERGYNNNRGYNNDRGYSYNRDYNNDRGIAPASVVEEKPGVSLNDFPSLGLGKAKPSDKAHANEKSVNSGKFNSLEEVVDVSSNPVIKYAAIIGTKVSEKPTKKMNEQAKVIKKSTKIDTKGKKIYMTQQQFLYDGHKYNAEDVIIVDDDGQEIYFSDNDYDDNSSDNNSIDEYEEDD